MAQNNKQLVKVLRWSPYTNKRGTILGFATIQWGDVAFSGVRLLKNAKGEHFVAMPSEADASGENYYNTVWLAFEDKQDARNGYEMICDAILEYIENNEPEQVKKPARKR